YQPVPIGAAVLVALNQNQIVLGDQQTRHRIARQILCKRSAAALVLVADIRRRPLERPGRCGASNMTRRKYLVEVTECADAIFRRCRIAGLVDPPAVLDRVVLGRTVKLGARATGGERRTIATPGSPTPLRRRRNAGCRKSGQDRASRECFSGAGIRP